MIRNLSDLAIHVGADGATEVSIARRLFKDTRCGISFGAVREPGAARDRVFVVRWNPSILGYVVASWRVGRSPWAGPDTLPVTVREWLEVDVRGRGASYDPRTIENAAILSRKEHRGMLTMRVRVSVPGPSRPAVVVSGYCEGTDAGCVPRVLVFPFTGAAFDAAVAAADQDGCDLWDETHGCPWCGTPATDVPPDADPGDGPDYDGPINPECPSCKGDGIIL